MAKLTFPTTRYVSGPLLIDGQALMSLDDIVDRHANALRDYREKEIEAATEKEIQRRLARGLLREEQVAAERQRIRQLKISISISRLERDSRSSVLYLKGGREVQAEKFSDAMNQPVGTEEGPVGFALYFAIGSIRATVSLANVRWSKKLSVEVEPNDADVAQSFFGALNNWASGIEAPKWQQKWLSSQSTFGTILVFWLVTGLFMVPLMWNLMGGKVAGRVEARKILGEGVNANNQMRAIQVLLAMETGVDVEGRTTSPGIRYWTYVGTGALALLCTVICPNVCIGVWKGKQSIRRWRTWITTVAVTIPLLLAGSALLPWVLHLLGLSPPT